MDASEVFQAAEEAFDPVALLVGDSVVCVGMLACWIGRDDRLAAVLGQPVAQGPRVIGAVSQQAAGRTGDGQQIARAGQVVGVAGGQDQREGPSPLIGQGVNLGGTTTARAPDAVMEGPPFAPAAERCALMCIESTEAVTPPITPLDPVRA